MRDLQIIQSTHPVWDATGCGTAQKFPVLHFNPRIPYGMRLACWTGRSRQAFLFQSTHPVWDATFNAGVSLHFGTISIHASRMGCDVYDSTTDKSEQ